MPKFYSYFSNKSTRRNWWKATFRYWLQRGPNYPLNSRTPSVLHYLLMKILPDLNEIYQKFKLVTLKCDRMWSWVLLNILSPKRPFLHLFYENHSLGKVIWRGLKLVTCALCAHIWNRVSAQHHTEQNRWHFSRGKRDLARTWNSWHFLTLSLHGWVMCYSHHFTEANIYWELKQICTMHHSYNSLFRNLGHRPITIETWQEISNNVVCARLACAYVQTDPEPLLVA